MMLKVEPVDSDTIKTCFYTLYDHFTFGRQSDLIGALKNLDITISRDQ